MDHTLIIIMSYIMTLFIQQKQIPGSANEMISFELLNHNKHVQNNDRNNDNINDNGNANNDGNDNNKVE